MTFVDPSRRRGFRRANARVIVWMGVLAHARSRTCMHANVCVCARVSVRARGKASTFTRAATFIGRFAPTPRSRSRIRA
eukprot:6191061-Pleurochrysis_carterae.AAC.1